MDTDHEEVVREPFEDVDNHYDDDNDQYIEDKEVFQEAGNAIESIEDDSLRYHRNDHHDQDNSSEVSTSSVTQDEDVKFAQSFGITLKNQQIKHTGSGARERLFNSIHIDPTESSSSNKDNPDEPVIRTSVTSDCIHHRGTFYQKGDIVALCDQESGQVYFAQLTGFLQDQYCEKSASLNWLVPTRRTSRQFFDPSAYRIGLEDKQLRKLDCMTFVRHCPHDYYLRKLYQLDDERLNCKASSSKEHSYIWTTMEPCKVPDIHLES